MQNVKKHINISQSVSLKLPDCSDFCSLTCPRIVCVWSQNEHSLFRSLFKNRKKFGVICNKKPNHWTCPKISLNGDVHDHLYILVLFGTFFYEEQNVLRACWEVRGRGKVFLLQRKKSSRKKKPGRMNGFDCHHLTSLSRFQAKFLNKKKRKKFVV